MILKHELGTRNGAPPGGGLWKHVYAILFPPILYFQSTW